MKAAAEAGRSGLGSPASRLLDTPLDPIDGASEQAAHKDAAPLEDPVDRSSSTTRPRYITSTRS